MIHRSRSLAPVVPIVRQCGKFCFYSRALARRHVAMMRRAGTADERHDTLRAYYCDLCAAWHFGHARFEHIRFT